jgi:hypothetical protein
MLEINDTLIVEVRRDNAPPAPPKPFTSPLGDVGGDFYSQRPIVSRQFLINDQDYSDSVLSWPSITTQWNDARPRNLSIELANKEQRLNRFFSNRPTLNSSVALIIGHENISAIEISSGSMIEHPTQGFLSGNIALSFFVAINSGHLDGEQKILWRSAATVPDSAGHIQIAKTDSNELELQYTPNSASAVTLDTTNYTFLPGRFHHVGAGITSGYLSMYVDGLLVGSESNGNFVTVFNQQGHGYIGGETTTGNFRISDFRVYNDTLDQDDFIALSVGSGDGGGGESAPWKPALGSTWCYQITGTVDETVDVHNYIIDLFDASAGQVQRLQNNGRRVIAYLSAGSWEQWRPDADDYPDAIKGNELSGYPDERWLDARALSDLIPLIIARLQLAVDKGFDGVDLDNMDSYQNSPGFATTESDQITFNARCAQEAHNLGLAVGLKNCVELIPVLVGHFDFCVNEQAWRYEEEAALAIFIAAGKPVFNVEYRVQDLDCDAANAMGVYQVLKGEDLDSTRTPCAGFTVIPPVPQGAVSLYKPLHLPFQNSLQDISGSNNHGRIRGQAAFALGPDIGALNNYGVFRGRLDGLTYSDGKVSMELVDKFHRLGEASVGHQNTPVLYSRVLPSTLVRDAVTSYAGLAFASYVDSASFYRWAQVFSRNNIFMGANLTGQSVTEILRDISRMTQSAIYVDHGVDASRLKFSLFTALGSASLRLDEAVTFDSEAVLDTDDVINYQYIHADYDITSRYHKTTVLWRDTLSAGYYGVREAREESQNIWFVGSISALYFAQRAIAMRAAPVVRFSVKTGLMGVHAAISDTVLVSDKLLQPFGGNVAGGYRVLGRTLDLDDGSVQIEAAEAGAIFTGSIDVSSTGVSSGGGTGVNQFRLDYSTLGGPDILL